MTCSTWRSLRMVSTRNLGPNPNTKGNTAITETERCVSACVQFTCMWRDPVTTISAQGGGKRSLNQQVSYFPSPPPHAAGSACKERGFVPQNHHSQAGTIPEDLTCDHLPDPALEQSSAGMNMFFAGTEVKIYRRECQETDKDIPHCIAMQRMLDLPPCQRASQAAGEVPPIRDRRLAASV